MKQKFSDSDILELLVNLKNAREIYPPTMIEERRASFIEQAAKMELLNAAGNGTSPGEDGGTSSPGIGMSGGLFSLMLLLGSVFLGTILLRAAVGQKG